MANLHTFLLLYNICLLSSLTVFFESHSGLYALFYCYIVTASTVIRINVAKLNKKNKENEIPSLKKPHTIAKNNDLIWMEYDIDPTEKSLEKFLYDANAYCLDLLLLMLLLWDVRTFDAYLICSLSYAKRNVFFRILFWFFIEQFELLESNELLTGSEDCIAMWHRLETLERITKPKIRSNRLLWRIDSNII